MAANTVDIIMRLVDQVSGRMNNVTNALNQVNAQGQKVNTTTQAMSKAFVGLTAIGVYQGLKQVADALYDVAVAGAQSERAMESFKIMTQFSGQLYTEVLGEMREASRGTISDLDLMTSANKALSLGVADTSRELAELVEVSTALGRRTGLGQEQSLERLLVGVGRLSPRILDDLGIAINLTRLYADATGKASSELDQQTKIQLVLNKVLEDGRKIINAYPDGLEDTMSSFERMDASWQNIKASLGDTALPKAFADFINYLGEGAAWAQMIERAQEGTASIEEYRKVLAAFEKDKQDRIDWNPLGERWAEMSIDHGWNDINENIENIRDNLNLSVAAADELGVKAEYIKSMTTAASAREDTQMTSQLESSGNALLSVIDDLQAAQGKLDKATAEGDTLDMTKASADIMQYQAVIRELVLLYNEAAEHKDLDAIDMAAAVEGTLQVEGLSQAVEVFTKDADKAKAEADALADAIKRSAEAGAEASRVFQSILGSKREALGGQIVDLLASDSSAGATEAATRARAAMESQMYRLTEAGLSEQQQQVIVNRAYQDGIAVIDAYTESLKKKEAAQAQDTVKKSGDQIVRLASLIADSSNTITGSTAQMAIESAGGLEAMQEQLRALGERYNEAAALAGVPLIDIDALTRGEIKAYDATAALDVLNRKQQEVQTMAHIAGDAVRNEAAALGMLQGAVEGAKAALLSQVATYSDVLDLDQQLAMLEAGYNDIDVAAKGVDATTGSVDEKYLRFMRTINSVNSSNTETVQGYRDADKAAADYADTIQNKLKSAFDSLNSVVSGELKDSLNELSKIGIGAKELEEAGGRQDVPAENARRLAALMKEGVKDQPWLEEFKKEAPEVWNEYITAADPKGAAARMLNEFQQGLRPELIDFAQLKEQIKQKMETQMRLEGMAGQLTAELIAEMGTDQSSMIQKFVGDALGTGIEESPFSADASAHLLSQFSSPDFAEQMKTAGGVSAMNWALGFNNDVPEYMLPFIDILAQYVLPIVQANIVATATATGAK